MSANPFKDIRVFYDGLGNTVVNWLLDHRFDDPFPHTFSLLFADNRAGLDTGRYALIDSKDKATQLTDLYFRDAGFARSAFYQVRLVTPAGTYLSAVKGLEGNVADPNVGVVKEILRKEALALRKDRGGIPGFLFKRRYYGPLCDCRDKNTDTLVVPGCLSCAGTGFKDGYFPGLPLSVMIQQESPKTAQISPAGISDVRQLQVRTLANPIADSKDIWMDADTRKTYEIRSSTVLSRMSMQPIAVGLELREMPLADTVSLILATS